jgi:hypothetical protein
MPKYTRKSEIVEAVQWTESNETAIREFAGDLACSFSVEFDQPHAIIYTPQGMRNARPGDWFVRQANGKIIMGQPEEFQEGGRYEQIKGAAIA